MIVKPTTGVSLYKTFCSSLTLLKTSFRLVSNLQAMPVPCIIYITIVNDYYTLESSVTLQFVMSLMIVIDDTL